MSRSQHRVLFGARSLGDMVDLLDCAPEFHIHLDRGADVQLGCLIAHLCFRKNLRVLKMKRSVGSSWKTEQTGTEKKRVF